jgi:hypothetical protein
LRTFARSSQSAVNQKFVESKFRDRHSSIKSEFKTKHGAPKVAARKCQHSLRCKVLNHL